MMSGSFNDNLKTFLISCRESAIRELAQINPEYKKLVDDSAAVSAEVKKQIPSEYELLLDELTDSMYELARMEANSLYFRGCRDCVSLQKRFDGAFDESADFEKEFM
jgi:hypothetical protein